jgi:hypothetical protein
MVSIVSVRDTGGDSSELDTLERLKDELTDSGVQLHLSLSEIKSPVEDKLRTAYFLERLKPGSIYLSTRGHGGLG